MNKGTVRSIPIVILLSIVTCGIYYLYWIYKTTDEIKNFMEKEDINPTLELILTLVTCNLYTLYWYYKYGKMLYLEMTKKAGMDSTEDNTTLLIILDLFVPVVSCGIFQDKLNSIWNSINDDVKVIDSQSDNNE